MNRETTLQYFNNMSDETKERINNGIEQNRKGNAVIDFSGFDKLLPDGTSVDVELTKHEFKFGANLFMLDELETAEKNQTYKKAFSKLFNLATLPFYWCDNEPEEGKTRYGINSPKIYRRPPIDLCMKYCEENNIEPKCHCLNYDCFLPDWLVGADVDRVKAMLSKRFKEISERYADKIPSFEVINEALRRMHKSDFYYEDDFVEWSFKEAGKYFKNNELLLNETQSNVFSTTSTNRNPYYSEIDRLLKSGDIHLDTIGIQYHNFCESEMLDKKIKLWYNPTEIFKLLDLYSRFGKKLQITEMTIPCYSDEKQDEEIQAEILTNLYRIFFSHPNMQGVIFWNLVDGYAAFAPQGDMTSGENKYYGTLMRFDLSEKPSYKALDNLINKEWHTSLSAQVKDNKINFRGFYGDYKITVHTQNGDILLNYKHSSK